MLPVEVCTHLAGAGLGLVFGTNLFGVPFPESAADLGVALSEPRAGESLRTYGKTSAALVLEEPRFLVHVRGAAGGEAAARVLAEQVRNKLNFADEVLSGVRYLACSSSPVYGPGYDKLERPVYYVDCSATKEPSTS